MYNGDNGVNRVEDFIEFNPEGQSSPIFEGRGGELMVDLGRNLLYIPASLENGNRQVLWCSTKFRMKNAGKEQDL